MVMIDGRAWNSKFYCCLRGPMHHTSCYFGRRSSSSPQSRIQCPAIRSTHTWDDEGDDDDRAPIISFSDILLGWFYLNLTDPIKLRNGHCWSMFAESIWDVEVLESLRLIAVLPFELGAVLRLRLMVMEGKRLGFHAEAFSLKWGWRVMMDWDREKGKMVGLDGLHDCGVSCGVYYYSWSEGQYWMEDFPSRVLTQSRGLSRAGFRMSLELVEIWKQWRMSWNDSDRGVGWSVRMRSKSNKSDIPIKNHSCTAHLPSLGRSSSDKSGPSSVLIESIPVWWAVVMMRMESSDRGVGCLVKLVVLFDSNLILTTLTDRKSVV